MFYLGRLFSFFFLLFSLSYANALQLTDTEKEFIKNNPTIKTSNIRDWAPYDYNQNGLPKGYAVDYIKLLAKKIGVKLEFVTDDWKNLLKKIQNKKIDILNVSSLVENRKEYLTFTKTFLHLRHVLITQKNSNIKDLYDFMDKKSKKKLSLVKGWNVTKKIKESFPNIDIMERENTNEILEDVAFGTTDACIDDFLTANYFINKNLLNNLKISSELKLLNSQVALHMGVRKDWEILRDIFDKAIDSLSEEEIINLNKKWLISNEKRIEFTKNEKDFIKNNPIIKVGAETNWAPFDYVEEGVHKGIVSDYLMLISEKSGLKFEIGEDDTWGKLLDKIENNKLDLLPVINYTKERDEKLNFTKKYLTARHYIFTTADAPYFTSLNDFKGKRIAIPKDFGHIEIIKKRFPKIKILETKNTLDSIDAIITKRADALLENYAIVNFVLKQNNIKNIKPAFSTNLGGVNNLYMATREDLPILRDILQKSLDSITLEEKNQINKKWSYIDSFIHLLPRESRFIETTPIRCITTTWAPFNMLIDEKIVGISHDYWDIINSELGLNSKCKIVDTWSEVLEAIKSKNADVTLGTSITDDREKYAVFSKPYATFPLAIATQMDTKYIADTSYLNGKKVAIGKNYSAHIILQKHYPLINFVPVKNTEDALHLLSKGDVFAAVDILPVLTYNMSKAGYSNLKISGTTEFSFDIRIMVRRGLEELVPILNKGIDFIEETQKNNIYNKWISIKFEKGFDYNLIIKVIAVACLFMLFSIYWNRKLYVANEKLQEAQEQLQKLAITDQLTNVYNRYKLDEVLNNEKLRADRYEQSFGVILIDIDFFKKVNDTYGHNVGDIVLKEFANILKQSIRKTDIVGRWGGEEFLIVLPQSLQKNTLQVAEEIRDTINNHCFQEIKNLRASFGVSIYKDKESIKSLIKRVDEALYTSKNSGRDQINFK